MLIAGITKVRNEEHLIQDTLDHFAETCDAIYVYDDYSTDATPDICEDHPAVSRVIRGLTLDPDRPRAEFRNRQAALVAAQRDNPEWILCFDADERIEMPDGWQDYDAVRMKLFDFYITEEDVDLTYKDRRWLGPEYREILMMYRNLVSTKFQYRDQREMRLRGNQKILKAGYVKHYGKAISVDEWEKTCDYYAEWPEPYATKWKNRRGQAVHSMSDFGRPLIRWDEKELYGARLTS